MRNAFFGLKKDVSITIIIYLIKVIFYCKTIKLVIKSN
jgi:hypothetical protein